MKIIGLLVYCLLSLCIYIIRRRWVLPLCLTMAPVMNEKNTITQLMAELGPCLSLRGVYQHNDAAWSIFFDDDREIFVNYHEPSSTLVYSCDLALPDLQDYTALYECLLSYNALWLKTDFARFALMTEKRCVELSQSLAAAQLTLVALADFSQGFNDRAVCWQSMLLSQPQSKQQWSSDALDELSEEAAVLSSGSLFMKV